MKKVVVLSITLLVLMLCTQVALAAEEDNLIVAPESSSVFMAYDALIDATSSSIICGVSSELTYPTSQSLYMELQKWNGSYWVKVKSWSRYDTAMSLQLRESYPKSPGTYRVTGTHQAAGETRYSYSPIKIID
ncbi:hypothetical protein [Zhaonella formicivorans]|uniref:hypothetical protein n=1 Tax=Zhaonella formicivorans TaxID=2528593 RepID=UPI0010EAC220|nr:hypothetical protein [Zhaonella formicivorans]